MAHCTPHRVGEASATELGTQNAPGKAPVRAQRRIINLLLNACVRVADVMTFTFVSLMPVHRVCRICKIIKE